VSVTEITPQQLNEVLASQPGARLIDVRPRVEFRRIRLLRAQNIPFNELSVDALPAEAGTSDSKVYVICKAGVQSRRACEKLAQLGFANAVSVQGGTDACLSAGLAAQHGQPGMSLERQVRLAAGSIVLITSILAITVSPYFAALSAFVGAGLVFAAVTDTCGMGMLLAKMPWNR
jgi:rhodanese-related sulfurtransferase